LKSKVCLAVLPSWGTTDIPLSLSTLASYLRANGVTAKPFDLNIELYNLLCDQREWWDLAEGLDAWQRKPFVEKFWDEQRPLLESFIDDILEQEPEYVGFTLFCSNRLMTEVFAARVKERAPQVKILFGGPELAHIHDLEKYAAEHSYVEHFVNGEGEEALLRIAQGQEPRRVVTVWNKASGLDAYPLQDFSDFDFRLYKDPFSFPMYSSRGCPNLCAYCTERAFLPFRTRTAERLFADVKKQKELYPFLKLFRLQESIGNGKMTELKKFCDMMIEADMGLKWSINNAVIRKEMTGEALEKLRKAGCIQVSFGLETPEPELLEDIGKRLARGCDIGKMVREVNEAGLHCTLNIMFGLPGETEEHFQEQLRFLDENAKWISIIAPSIWFTYFPENSRGFKNPDEFGIDVSYGPLYWKSKDGENDYIVRMNRFIRYTDKMAELGVPNVFGYPILTNRDQLVREYLDECVRLGKITKEEADAEFERRKPLRSPVVAETRKPWWFPIKLALRRLLVAITPATIPNGYSDAARGKRLEQELKTLIERQRPLFASAKREAVAA
jgi:hypothetical protein